MTRLQKYALKKIENLAFNVNMEIYKQREKLGGESSADYKHLKAAMVELEELAASMASES